MCCRYVLLPLLNCILYCVQYCITTFTILLDVEWYKEIKMSQIDSDYIRTDFNHVCVITVMVLIFRRYNQIFIYQFGVLDF